MDPNQAGQNVTTLMQLPPSVLAAALWVFGAAMMSAVGVTAWVVSKMKDSVSWKHLAEAIEKVVVENRRVHDEMAISYQRESTRCAEKNKEHNDEVLGYLKGQAKEIASLGSTQTKMKVGLKVLLKDQAGVLED